MSFKHGKFGHFYGCVRFPACKGLQKANSDGLPLGVPATVEVRSMRSSIIQSVEHGMLDPMCIAISIQCMDKEACHAVLGEVRDFPDPVDPEDAQRLLDMFPLLDSGSR